MIPIRLQDDAWREVEEGTEALVERWLVGEGEAVDSGQPVADVVLAKTDFELLAPAAGRIEKILIHEEETFARGVDLALLNEEVQGGASPTNNSTASVEADDAVPVSSPQSAHKQSCTSLFVPFAGIRGAVARNMTSSWQTAPQVTLMAEADVSLCEDRRKDLKNAAGAGVTLSITHFILRAVALTLKDHPRLNARVTSSGVEVASDIHLGLAVNVEEGLLVPVIRYADRKPTLELAIEAKALAEAARAKRLGPSDFQGATFTISTLGTTRVEWFTPIINIPQVAILGVGMVQRRPVIRGNDIVAAPTLKLSLVFDHRAVDGYPAGLFLTALCERLESAEDL